MALDTFFSFEAQPLTRRWLWLSSIALITTVVALFIALSIIAVYRLYIHPLHHVPGPRLAAISNFYGFYHNYIKEGGYSKRFHDLHKMYASPVIRIGPNHVHVNSPDFFDEVFRAGSAYAKDPSFYRNFGGIDSMVEPEEFRTYRTHISSLYSTRSVDGLAPRILTELQEMSKRLEKSAGTSETINIERMFRTLSADMVLRLLFPQDVNLFQFDGYHPFLEAVDVIMTQTWLMLSYPLVGMALSLIPMSNYSKVKSAFDEFTKYCEGWVNDVQHLQDIPKQPPRDSHMTRYLNIDPKDQAKAKSVPHPSTDIFNFIAGGRDTTAYSMSCAVHYLLASPDALAKLQDELHEFAPFIHEEFDHKRIQSLVYLTAVIKETLRLANPVPGCLPRIVPEGGASIGSIYVPAGMALSISLIGLQQNAELFPNPEKFRPERWLGEEGKAINKWNIAFSRGPRQCIGLNLAYLEMYSCLAYLFSRFEFRLPEEANTSLEWCDRFVATNKEDVKVMVVKDRWA